MRGGTDLDSWCGCAGPTAGEDDGDGEGAGETVGEVAFVYGPERAVVVTWAVAASEFVRVRTTGGGGAAEDSAARGVTVPKPPLGERALSELELRSRGDCDALRVLLPVRAYTGMALDCNAQIQTSTTQHTHTQREREKRLSGAKRYGRGS
jgi:hypothetical protein